MKNKFVYAILASVLMAAPVWANNSSNATTGTTGMGYSGINSSGIVTGSELETMGYDSRNDFSSQVTDRLNALEGRSSSLSGGDRDRYNQMRNSLRSDLNRINTIDKNSWNQYRGDVSNNLNELEGMFDSETSTR